MVATHGKVRQLVALRFSWLYDLGRTRPANRLEIGHTAVGIARPCANAVRQDGPRDTNVSMMPVTESARRSAESSCIGSEAANGFRRSVVLKLAPSLAPAA